MKTFYLVDFDNVHDNGIMNIQFITDDDQVDIFSAENNAKINIKYLSNKKTKVNSHLVPSGNQSVDMHIVSYLGYLLCENGNECSYVIVSNDKDYDNIIRFWIEEKKYTRILRKDKIPAPENIPKISNAQANSVNTPKKCKKKVSLYDYMQEGLRRNGINDNAANAITEIVVLHNKDEDPLNGIDNDIKKKYNKDYGEKYYAEAEKIYNSFLKANSD